MLFCMFCAAVINNNETRWVQLYSVTVLRQSDAISRLFDVRLSFGRDLWNTKRTKVAQKWVLVSSFTRFFKENKTISDIKYSRVQQSSKFTVLTTDVASVDVSAICRQ